MQDSDVQSDAEVLQKAIALFAQLAPDSVERLLNTLATFYGVAPTKAAPTRGQGAGIPFSEDTSLSPKEFVLAKNPKTDIERAACLAYYLTHYRETPYFKTVDLSKLNTEAAQPKFANATWVADNAMKRGYLATATRGSKQLSAAGERFVQALPDREAAKAIMAEARPRRRPAKRSKAKPATE